MLSIASNHKSILKDNKPFFYLADTCWSAFTNITDEEWEFYLYQRKMQGFNAIQINILPQWDASPTDLKWRPIIDNDWFQWNDAYFEHARTMSIKAKEMGFELTLVILWCNYVPDTWATKYFHTESIPFEALENYVYKVHETFTDLHPIYAISGDTDFKARSSIKYYEKVAKLIKKLAPKCLITTHMEGNASDIPEELIPYMDILFYQSGHNIEYSTKPYNIVKELALKYPNMPIINAEPCYEEMGHFGKNAYGRWHQYDIRSVAYKSILAGSCGIAYGAAGIYSWHKINKGTSGGLGDSFDTPKPFQQALLFPGAWDYGYLKNLMESIGAYSFIPRQDLLVNDTEEIRVSEISDSKILVYVPHNTKVKLKMNLTGWDVKAIGLENRYISNLDFVSKEEMSVIELHPFHEDALYIIQK